ncbi:peptidoglycan-binding domain-containing protein [Serratia sp. UGAL515B_01]|uniref:peptidoglycan-binding domain-containing protein n=1 Tax=Serratia sp. UGAL515B_01 TaxID=2986763 RepID=UPI002955DCA9|nr:peptidoglycan-binding domain-containing protein [Serratia sp. UGAL515B_01]WON77767.1 peptidoglycan-binding domain-containing protein [Serratia sp. UGAL515B_01]
MKELSGVAWVSRFQGSTSTNTLSLLFKKNIDEFLLALRNAGAKVTISATLRPPERAYLMHWSWKIAKGLAKPHEIPTRAGVNIEWAHQKADGTVDISKSTNAAKSMVSAYGMINLNVAPALTRRHIEGNAIDMDISWTGDLEIKDKDDKVITIKSLPRDGMNIELHAVEKSFGVIKYNGGSKDKPHWSTDGR